MEQVQKDAFLLFSSPWQRLPFFQGLPNSTIQKLLENSNQLQLKSKSVIFKQGQDADSFGFVIEGYVKLFRTSESNCKTIMDIAVAGSMIAGLLMSHQKISYPITAQTMGPALFLKIPKKTFEQYWINDPEVIRRTQQANFDRMDSLQRVREIQNLPLKERIAEILVSILVNKKTEFQIQISRTDLADITSSRVESVIRVFSAWEKSGVTHRDEFGKEYFNYELYKRGLRE